MTDAVLKTVIVLVAALPLITSAMTAAGARFWPKSRVHWPTIFGCGGSLIGALSLLPFLGDSGTIPVEPLVIYHWISLPDSLFHVSLGLQIDALALALLTVVTFAILSASIHAAGRLQGDAAARRFFASVSLLQFAVTMLLMSTNFLELFFFWKLTAVTGSLLTGLHPESRRAATAVRRMLIVNGAVDVALLTGILLLWGRCGSFEFSVALNFQTHSTAAAHDGSPELVWVGLCLFAAAAVRCGQFPFLGRDDEITAAPSRVPALLQGAALMPAGVFLMARCLPLLERLPEVRLLMLVIGGLTALLSAAAASVQTNPKQALSDTSKSLFGLMFVGLGSGERTGFVAAMFLLIVHILAKTALFLITDTVLEERPHRGSVEGAGRFRRDTARWRWLFLICVGVLASGLWGQNAVLTAVWNAGTGTVPVAESTRQETEGAVERPLSRPKVYERPLNSFSTGQQTVCLMVYWSAMLSMLLSAYALCRGYYLTFYREPSSDEFSMTGDRETTRSGFVPPLLLTLTAAAVGPLTAGPTGWFNRLLESTWPARAGSESAPVFAMDVGLLLVALGGLSAWMLHSQPLLPTGRLADVLRPVAKFVRNRYELAGCGFLLGVLPVRGAAQLCRFFDWIVIDALSTALPARILRLLAGAAGPLQNGLVQFYALSLAFAAAVLLVVLTLLGGMS